MKKTLFILVIIAVFVTVLFVLNSRSNPPEATPSASLTPTLTVSPTKAPITNKTYEVLISSGGLSRQTLNIKTGDTVKFTNNDSLPHWLAAGPHPAHTICPGFDFLRGLAKDETYSFTFAEAKTCPFHDHLNAGNANYKGTINVSDH